MAKNTGFRFWFYFRMGWSTYFAFIFAAINTLTVTYFLAIENYPLLNSIFPTFFHYIAGVSGLGVPMLILIGYLHFKRTPSYRSETAITYETNPFARRIFVNSELNLQLNQELIELILKLSQDKKLSTEDLSRVNSIKEKMDQFTKERTLDNKKDLDFLNKVD
jgi:hypothetical protein